MGRMAASPSTDLIPAAFLELVLEKETARLVHALSNTLEPPQRVAHLQGQLKVTTEFMSTLKKVFQNEYGHPLK